MTDAELRDRLKQMCDITDEQIDEILKVYKISTEELIMEIVNKGTELGCSTTGEIHDVLPYIFPDAISTLKPKDFTDASNAEIFARRNKSTMYYCGSLGWILYDGKRWTTDEAGAMQKAIAYADEMVADAKRGFNDALRDVTSMSDLPKEAKQYLNHALRTKSRASLVNMLALAQSYMPIKISELDSDPYLLNTAAGIVDLRTGEIRQHDSTQLCTKIAPVAPSHEGEQIWLDFLDLITCGNAELREYMQVVAGMCAIGKITEEFTLFAVGGGRNGKTTYFNALSKVLGDYADTMDSTALTTSDRQNKAVVYQTLVGKRLITCGELEEGHRLSIKTLKDLSGADSKMQVKKLYKDLDTATKSHHICLFTNFLPRIGSTDDGTWRRIKVIPFNATMPTGSAEISNYCDILCEKAGGAILQWIIDGARLFIENGERINGRGKSGARNYTPKVVTDAIAQYREREDWINVFISECCVVGKDKTCRAGELYKLYVQHCRDTSAYPHNRQDFTVEMLSKKYKKDESRGRVSWKGIGILDDSFSSDDAYRTGADSGELEDLPNNKLTPFDEIF